MDIVGPLLLLGGAIFVVSKRCELLGLCGETGDIVPEASAEEVPGNVDESASNRDENGNWAGGNKSCCECAMQGDRVKCRRHGGEWFNPPAGPGGSNDQSVELSLEECNKGCGTTGTDPRIQERDEQKGVVCPAGYNSVNGKCVRSSNTTSNANRDIRQGSSSGSGKATGRGNNTPSRRTPARRPSTGIGAGVSAGARIPARRTARYTVASYYTPPPVRSYFVDPNYIRPFTVYHRIAN